MRATIEKSGETRERAAHFRNVAKDHQPRVAGTDRERRAKATREFGKWADLREEATKEALRSENR